MPIVFVGDLDQMCYRWSGAAPEVTSRDAKILFPDLITLKLETNYRSAREVIDQSVLSISHNYSDKGGPYDQAIFKQVQPRNGAPEGLPFSFEMYADQQAEAVGIAARIEELCAHDGYTWGDFFVGARTRSQLGFVEGALTQHAIKYVNLAGGSFWSSKHVQDVIAYVKLACREDDDDAFKRIYNIASRWFVAPFGARKGEYINHRYLGREFIESVGGSYTNITRANWRYRAGVDDLRTFISELQMTIESGGVGAGIAFVIDNCYAQWLAAEEGLLNTDESENGKLDDLRTVIEVAMRFDIPEAFFEYVSDMIAAAEEVKSGDHSKVVVISTVHRLKGKERPVVFGIGICEGEQSGFLKKPVGLLPHTFSLTSPPNFGVLPTGGKGRIEDERCLFFVLISRAEERVYLSGIRQFRETVMVPSRFVHEINLIEGELQL